jgi:hypothetical protein
MHGATIKIKKKKILGYNLKGAVPVETRFSAPVQTGPAAHPASYITGTLSFLGVKWPGRGIEHPTTSSAEVKERL